MVMARGPPPAPDGGFWWDVRSCPGPSVVRFGFNVLDRVEQAVAMVKERLTRAVNALETAGRWLAHEVKQ